MLILIICLISLYHCLNFPVSTAQIKGIEDLQLLSLNSFNRSEYYDTVEKIVYDNGPEKFAKEKSIVHEYYVWHAPPSSVGQPWPKPRSISISHQFLPVSEILTFNILNIKCELIILAIERYKKRIFLDKMITHVSIDSLSNKTNICKNKKCEIEKISISVDLCSNGEIPNENMEESYQLQISLREIKLSSQQTWGLLRGLETLAQLMFLVVDLDHKWLAISKTIVIDNPKYKHRGLMIDTSRHFIPVYKLLENLNAMEMNKLNVFHWHISDDQSFPFQSKSHPELHTKGSFHINMTYSYIDIRHIVEYARQRGIRVIPEIDVPGHTSSWEKSHYELLTECQSINKRKFFGPLNPILKETYLLLKNLYTELFNLFPDTHIHLGLDEVGRGCWTTDPKIQQFMKLNKIENVDLLLVIFIHKLQALINLNFPNKKLIVWEEASEKNINLTKNSIVQIWKSRIENLNSVKKGYPIIYSTSYYLDHVSYGASWVQFYVNDFENYVHLKYIGGEACMWNEFQSKETISQNIWPAMCAISEILWYGRRNIMEAASQLEEQRCRMLRTGISVGVGSGPSECLYLPDTISLSFNMSCPITYLIHEFPNFVGILKTFLIFIFGFMSHYGIQVIIRHKIKVYSNYILVVLLLIICLIFYIGYLK